VSAVAVWFVDIDAVVRDLRTGHAQKAESETASASENDGAKLQGRLPDSLSESAPAEGPGTNAVVRPMIMPEDGKIAEQVQAQPTPDGTAPIDVATAEGENPDAATPEDVAETGAPKNPNSNVANDPSWSAHVVKPRPPAAPPRAPALAKSQPAPVPHVALPAAEHSYSLDERIAELRGCACCY
jgi:hypothetical protein